MQKALLIKSQLSLLYIVHNPLPLSNISKHNKTMINNGIKLPREAVDILFLDVIKTNLDAWSGKCALAEYMLRVNQIQAIVLSTR